MDDFLGGDGSDDSDVLVQRAQLHGAAPFPTWNGTVAAASGTAIDGRCSVLCENGDVVVLQTRREQALDSDVAIIPQGKCTAYVDVDDFCGGSVLRSIQVEKILRSSTDKVSSFCQCWSSDGSVFATAHNRRVAFYNVKDDFRIQLSMQVRFSVTSMDIVRLPSEGDDRAVTYLLAAGTAFGAHLYTMDLSTPTNNPEQDSTTTSSSVESLPPLASAYEETPICFVKFSHDGATVALGSVDGRLYVRSLANNTTDLTAFGTLMLSKVLAAPRVTSICFSPCSRKLAVATRKGNVYVLTQASSTGEWRQHTPCKELSSNPKLVTQPSSSSVAAMQTLVCWWSSEVLVVASRAANYRLEMLDVTSGKRLHTLEIDTRSANSELSSLAVADGQLLTGVCCVKLVDGHTKLVCHDTSSNLLVISWPLLEMEESSSNMRTK